MTYQYTKDWFSWAPQVWEQLIPLLPEGDTFAAADKPVRNFLEIGSFEGRSAVWIIENMMQKQDTITCIDTWQGGEDHTASDMQGAEARFDANINLAFEAQGMRNSAVRKYKSESVIALAEELEFARGLYAFIYIDGSHIAKDVLTDACMAWPLLKNGGLMVFDDYSWGEPRDILHRPKAAIDAFTNLFAEELEVLHTGYQLVVRKRK